MFGCIFRAEKRIWSIGGHLGPTQWVEVGHKSVGNTVGGVRRASAALLPTYLCTRDINIIIRVTLIIMQKFSAV